MLKNIVFNFLGKFWSILSNFLFIPFYIHFLGVSSFSVISFSLIVVSVLMILDLGLSAGVTREMARADTSEADKYRAFKTLEKFYFLLLLLCVVIGLFLSQPIAAHLIEETPIDRRLIALCLSVIAMEAGLQLYFRFYYSTLMGMEKQVAANIFTIALGLVRNGMVVALIMTLPTLPHFFFWQLLSTLLAVLLAKYYVGRVMEPWRPAEVSLIDISAILRIRRFVGGVVLISLVAVINTQVDRILISRLLPLDQLGYYTVAVSIGMGMLAVSSPFLSAMQPQLTKWYSEGRLVEAKELYLRMATFVASLTFPLMAVIGTSPKTVLHAWTGNTTIAEKASVVLPWVVATYSFLAVSNQTYGVALANAHTRYNNAIGILTLFVSVPGYWVLINRFGIAGASMLFLFVQIFSSTSYQFLVNRRFLQLDFLRTYLQLFMFPMLVSVSLALGFREVISAPEQSRRLMLAYLAAKYLFVLAGTMGAMVIIFRPNWCLSRLASRWKVGGAPSRH